jgi:hypothetical protein
VAIANAYNTDPIVILDYNNRRASADATAINQKGGKWCARPLGGWLACSQPDGRPAPCPAVPE